MHSLRTLLSSLVLLALLTGGAVPAGFMPGKRDGGFVKIEICTASGWSTAEIPADSHADSDHARKTCPYAPVLAQNFVAVAQLAAFTLPSIFIPPGAAQTHGPAAAKHWHAQGPPSVL